MADFVSLNEFIDRTASSTIDQHIDTLRAGYAKAVAERAPRGLDMAASARLPRDLGGPDLGHEFDRMKKFVLGRYAKATSQNTFLDAGGNFVDCIGYEQQQAAVAAMAAGHKLLDTPPAAAALKAGKSSAKRALRPVDGIRPPLAQGATDPFGNPISCPPGTVPVRRITLSQFARMGRFDRFFEKAPRTEVPQGSRAALPSSGVGPDGYVHRHAIATTPVGSYTGCTTFLNLWGPDPSPGEMHLSQAWVVGPDPSGASPYPDTIESGWQVSPEHWGTNLPVLFIFFNPDGYGTRSAPGQSRAGYGVNQFGEGFISFKDTKWVANSSAGSFSTLSVPGGPQKGFYMQWQRDGDGNWILYCGTTKNALDGVGYFPAYLYANTFLAQSARYLQFGGEVASKSPLGTGPMGSGVMPKAPATGGFGTVAFQKEISVQTETGKPMTNASLTVSPDVPSYLALSGMSTNSDWGPYLFFGGASGPL